MFAAVASVLNIIVQPCYALTGNWWLAIALFTLITKVILMPLSLWVQKNSIVMVQVMPDLNRIKVKHFGDRETIGELQTKLNKEHGYHPLLSLIPLGVQIIILFGLVDVIHGITDSGAAGTEFLGLVPVTDGGMSLVMPILAGLSAVALGCAQNRINPLQREQSKAEKNTTNGLSIGLSLILGFYVATGMAFYWIVSNLSAILVQVLCNIIIKPAKYIDYDDLNQTRDELEALNSIGEKKSFIQRMRDPLTKREKADIKRFYNVKDKHLVFFSEYSGYYKYFQGAIEWVLGHSDIPIHYITKDPNDQVFRLAETNPRLIPYYMSEQKLITVMMKMDADMVCMSLGDLDEFYIKRSYVRKDIEYIYLPHHMTSTGPTSHKTEYSNYDTLFCVGPEQVEEQKRFEEVYAHEGVRKKNLVPIGYDLIDRQIASYQERLAAKEAAKEAAQEAAKEAASVATGAASAASEAASAAAGTASAAGVTAAATPERRPAVLIGPSWQPDNLCDSCMDTLIQNLLGHEWRIIVRPHPEYLKRWRPRWEELMGRWKDIPEEDLYFEQDFSTNDSILDSDVLITDWSSVAFEFAFSTKKPCIFVNTQMKLNNPNYAEFAPNPSDITLRDRVGKSFEKDELDTVAEQVAYMIEHSDEWAGRISDIVDEMIFNPGRGGEMAGEYIINRLLEIQQAKGGAPVAASAPVDDAAPVAAANERTASEEEVSTHA